MSRFYEALKQAGQLLHPDEGTEPPSADLPGLLGEIEAGEPANPLEGIVSPVSDVSPSLEPYVAQEEKPQNGTPGLLTEAVLDKKARLIPNATDPGILEHYRLLRTKIMQQRSEKIFRTLLVASAGPREGKTITVLNLALAFSMLKSFRVLVVDGDMRFGSLSKSLGIQDRSGLSNLLEGSRKLNEVILKSTGFAFHFMARGNSKLSPPELLHSGRWPAQASKIREHFDLVIVDSPPVSLVTDSQLLASGCEAVLLVARAFQTSREALEKASQEFRRFRLIGTVLNGSKLIGSYRGYRSYLAATDEEDSGSTPAAGVLQHK